MPLIDSDKWTHKMVSLKALRFHPTNPRLPDPQSDKSEREIIEALCAFGDIEALAKEITDKGWLRNDRLIAVAEGRKYIIYEGNRRLCALKLLDNPSLAPKSKVNTYTKLSKLAKLPSKIAIEVVPSTLDAEIVMYTKHTGAKFIVPWKPLQQAAFIVGRLDGGDTVESLESNHGLEKSVIARARAAVDLYKLVSAVVPKGDLRDIVDDPTKFPYSTIFDRFFAVPDVAKIIGVRLSSEGLSISADHESLAQGIVKLVKDAHGEEVDTRKLGSKEQQIEYAKSLAIKKTESEHKVDEVIEKLKGAPIPQHKRETKSKEAPKAKTPPPKKGHLTTTLLPSSVAMSSNQKLLFMRNEATALSINNFPYASGVLLRVILECGLKTWLITKKKWGDLEKDCKKEDPKNLGPTLHDILKWVVKARVDLGLNVIEAQGLEAFLTKDRNRTKFELDRVIHHPTELADGAKIASLRENVLPLILKIYSET